MLVERLTFPSPAIGPLMGTRISYQVERQVRLDNGLVEVGKFRWPCPVEHEVTAEDDVFAFNLALSPRPPRAKIARLGLSSGSEPESIGRVLLISPGCTFRLSVPTGQVRSLYCGIDRRRLEQIIDGPADFDEDRWRAQFKSSAMAIELLLNRIYEELREDRFAAELAIESYLNALCVELARCFKPAVNERAVSYKGGLAPWLMRLLRDRIHAEAPAPQLSELADLSGMTVRQLGRAFKVDTGRTLGKYIDEVIVERAIRQLTETDSSISVIAAALGFATSASFTYSFRRSTGVLPSELRRRGGT